MPSLLTPRVRARIIDPLVHAYTRVRYMFPNEELSMRGIEVRRNIVYGPTDHAVHRMDVYAQTGVFDGQGGQRPAMLYVHGGGFQMLSKETHRVMALHYARAGYIVFVPNYRLAPEHPAPAQLHDVVRAARFVLREGGRFGADDRLVFAGESAGGNLVTALALLASARDEQTPEFGAFYDAVGTRLRAVVATYGLLDLVDRDGALDRPKVKPFAREMAHRAAQAYVLGTAATAEPRKAVGQKLVEYPYYSPLTWLEGGATYKPSRPLPQFFVDCGTRDPLFGQSRRLAKAITAAGGSAEFLVVPGGIHAYDVLGSAEQRRKKWDAVTAFLATV